MYDFVGIGEMLIDFTPLSSQENPYPLYQLNPGGAPANVACVMAKLGLRSSFIGKVGRDGFGQYCKKALDDAGCDSNHLVFSNSLGTTLAFITLSPDGNRSFSFYRNETTADVNLSLSDISEDIYRNTKIFHFGSVSLTQEPARTTTLDVIRRGKHAGVLISYDPNLRLHLWDTPENARKGIMDAMPLADLVKISDDECEFLFPGVKEDDAAHHLIEAYSLKLLIITKGKKGCTAYLNGKRYDSPAFDVLTIDTTGAGDAFWAGILLRLIKADQKINNLTDSEVIEILSFANALGSLVTTKRGAIAAIPTIDEIETCMHQIPHLNL